MQCRPQATRSAQWRRKAMICNITSLIAGTSVMTVPSAVGEILPIALVSPSEFSQLRGGAALSMPESRPGPPRTSAGFIRARLVLGIRLGARWCRGRRARPEAVLEAGTRPGSPRAIAGGEHGGGPAQVSSLFTENVEPPSGGGPDPHRSNRWRAHQIPASTAGHPAPATAASAKVSSGV